MIAREWKARCPLEHKEGFVDYLYQTGIKDTQATKGFLGAQILLRDLDKVVEITLITFWLDLESIQQFAGMDVETARLYPEDEKFHLEPDFHVTHYEVRENRWSEGAA